MGFLLETAQLDGTGLDPAALERGLARADSAAARIPGAPFAVDLDRPHALPSRADAERIVVLGIGGSALGTRVVHEACGTGGEIPIVVVDNIDPQPLERAWHGGDPRRTIWVAVSKSGGTTETLAQCAVVRERLRDLDAAQRMHVVTGARGPLRDLAAADGLPVHPIPEDVGGRYSVFTPASTVPLALAGHDVAGLLEGARRARDHCARRGSVPARLAALLTAAEGAGRNVVALWCYGERLEPVGEWFRQLWAESLGKKRGDGTRAGQSPIHCVGSTDQHSIQQLMVEGPPDKAVLVLAGPPSDELPVPATPPSAGAGHRCGRILDAMRRATTAGMVRAGCPAATLKLEDWSEGSVGSLLMTFLAATVVGGELLGVDPYGQPGVEAAKKATRELLGAPGGETDRTIATLLGEGGGVRCP